MFTIIIIVSALMRPIIISIMCFPTFRIIINNSFCLTSRPVRPGDHLTLFAEIDLLGALSACPGGDCSSEHSSDTSKCYPLKVDIYKPLRKALVGWSSPNTNGYSRRHGVDQTS
mgnify:CR=1 FL=1